MNENKLNQAATALASLDLSQEVEAITALQAAAAEIETAQEAAARRIREIADTLASQRAAAEAVADALVAGQDPSAAATAGPGADALRDEKDALKAGIAELEDRREKVRREIEALRDQAYSKVAVAARPLADAIEAELRDAAERTVAAFAAASALSDATRSYASLRFAAETAAKAVAGPDKALPGRERAKTPAEVLEALASIERHGAALKARAAPASYRI